MEKFSDDYTQKLQKPKEELKNDTLSPSDSTKEEKQLQASFSFQKPNLLDAVSTKNERSVAFSQLKIERGKKQELKSPISPLSSNIRGSTDRFYQQPESLYGPK